MQYSLLLTLTAFWLAFPPLSLADTSSTDEAGVWSGSVGNRKITACFNQSANTSYGSGAYYFEGDKQLVLLTQDVEQRAKTGNSWEERTGRGTGAWQLHTVQSALILGTAGKAALPIRLSRVMVPDYSADTPACTSDAFNKPIEPPLVPVYGPIIRDQGIQYRRITLRIEDMSQQTAEILGSAPAHVSINHWLRGLIDEEAPYECRRNALLSAGNMQLGLTVDLSVVASWLAIKRQSGHMCGSHGISVEETHHLWNLKTGTPENLLDWFKGTPPSDVAHKDGNTSGKLPPPLAKLVVAQLGQEIDSCYSAHEAEQFRFGLSLRNTGILFAIPSAGNGACAFDKELSFNRLTPFFNDKGRTNVRQLLRR